MEPSTGSREKREAMDLINCKVLVTGAGGFIGSHLCEALLERGAQVRALAKYNSRQSHGMLEQLHPDARKSLEVILGDVRDPFDMKRAVRGCGVVFHLAALVGIPFSYHAPKSYIDTNVSGTLNVLQASLEEGVQRVVHTSTSEVYGTAVYTPIDEDHRLQGQSPYSASKIGADKIAESYHAAFGLPVVIIRPFNCFGPRQSARAFIPAMICQILGPQHVRSGALEPVRDYTYVEDTVEGFLACGTKEGIEGMTINVGSGQDISMGDLLNLLMNMMNAQKQVVRDVERLRPEKSEVMKLVCDNSRAASLLGWKPKWSLYEGLEHVISYVRRNMHLYKPELYGV
jgi:NAD dependent epimerase/dehydratase